MAKANKGNSPTFILSFHGTDNKFSFKDVFRRDTYIYEEMQKRGIQIEVFGSDGDSRFIKSQKLYINFGRFEFFAGFQLAGNLNSRFLVIKTVCTLPKSC